MRREINYIGIIICVFIISGCIELTENGTEDNDMISFSYNMKIEYSGESDFKIQIPFPHYYHNHPSVNITDPIVSKILIELNYNEWIECEIEDTIYGKSLQIKSNQSGEVNSKGEIEWEEWATYLSSPIYLGLPSDWNNFNDTGNNYHLFFSNTENISLSFTFKVSKSEVTFKQYELKDGNLEKGWQIKKMNLFMMVE